MTDACVLSSIHPVGNNNLLGRYQSAMWSSFETATNDSIGVAAGWLHEDIKGFRLRLKSVFSLLQHRFFFKLNLYTLRLTFPSLNSPPNLFNKG